MSQRDWIRGTACLVAGEFTPGGVKLSEAQLDCETKKMMKEIDQVCVL